MNSNSERLQQEAIKAVSTHTPTGVRLRHARPKDQELVEVSHAFQVLLKHGPQEPSATHWRDFTRSLATRLEEESKATGFREWSQTVRDKFIATDSVALRALGYALLVVLLVLAAALVWVGYTFSMSLLDGPAHACLDQALAVTHLLSA